MITLLLIVLAVIGLGCALFLARGGMRGPATANVWWSIQALVTVALALHLLGYLLPDLTWAHWPTIGIALTGWVFAGLRERTLWVADLLPRPGPRESLLEFVFGVIALFGAITLKPFFPNVHQLSLVMIVLLPLMLLRWAMTRVA